MITFPCEFPIKIIFKNEPGAAEALLAIIRHHHPEFSEKDMKTQSSQQGNFQSFTANVLAQDQASLDALYQDLTKNSHVKMVL